MAIYALHTAGTPAHVHGQESSTCGLKKEEEKCATTKLLFLSSTFRLSVEYSSSTIYE